MLPVILLDARGVAGEYGALDISLLFPIYSSALSSSLLSSLVALSCGVEMKMARAEDNPCALRSLEYFTTQLCFSSPNERLCSSPRHARHTARCRCFCSYRFPSRFC